MNKQERLAKTIKNYHYLPDQQIGKGSNAKVYRGINLTTEEPVAIKVIDKTAIKTEIEHMLMRNEIKAVKLMAHENVMHTHEVCQTPNNVYIISELCQQGDLGALVRERGAFKEEEAISMFKQILRGLQHIHSKGVLHRDVKSANILLRNGQCKIADFGYVEFPAERQGGGYNVGSPLYMSPEAYRKSQYSEKSDCWAAGIILYEMLKGQQPFQGVDYNTMIKQVASAQCYRELPVSSFVKMLLSKMLSIDVERRANADEALTLLKSSQPKIVSETIIRPSSQNHPRQTMMVSRQPFQSRCPELPSVKVLGENKQISIVMGDVRKTTSVSPVPIQRQSKTQNQLPLPGTVSPKKVQIVGSTNRISVEADKPHSSQNKLPGKLDVLLCVLNSCEMLHTNPKFLSAYLLSVKHLQQLLRTFEVELRSSPLSENARNILHGITKKTTELVASASLEKVNMDPYFTHMLTQTSPDSQAYLEYLQYWLKTALTALGDALKKQLNNSAEKALLPQTFSCYAHIGHYYLLVDGLRRKADLAVDSPFLRLARDTNGATAQNIHHLNEFTQNLIV